MKKLLRVLGLTALLVLGACGGGGGGGASSPHKGHAEPQFCETGWIWSSTAGVCEVDLISSIPSRVDSLFTSLVNEYVARSSSISVLPTAMTYIRVTDAFNGTSVLGGCLKFGSGNREIWINRTEWNTKSNNEKKFIMFHELGHCVQNLNHTFGADNLDCLPQLEDDTVRVMDACQEKSETAHVVNNPEDWKIKDKAHSVGPYYYSSDLPTGYVAWQYEPIFGDYGYYILINDYTLANVFADFFNE